MKNSEERFRKKWDSDGEYILFKKSLEKFIWFDKEKRLLQGYLVLITMLSMLLVALVIGSILMDWVESFI